MSLPPMPQFIDTYEGTKQRYLVQILETTFSDYDLLQAAYRNAPFTISQVTTSGNTSTSATLLYSQLISTSNVLPGNWQIYIQAYGTFASNTNNKELILYLNSDVIFDSTAVAVNGGNWNIEATIAWGSSTSQSCMVTSNSSNSTFPSTAVYTATSEAFSSPITVSLTGTGGATNDIVGQVFIVTVQG